MEGGSEFTQKEAIMRGLIAAATAGLFCAGIAQACGDHCPKLRSNTGPSFAIVYGDPIGT